VCVFALRELRVWAVGSARGELGFKPLLKVS
jgi:hypothetical protein